MRWNKIVTISLLLAGLGSFLAMAEEKVLDTRSLNQLKQRLEAVDAELEHLAHLSLRNGIGSIGYRSRHHKDSDHREWVQIELGDEAPIDEIVLVPSVWRDHKRGFQADGFPQAFRILVGSKDDLKGTEIAAFGTQDQILPRIAPLVVSCSITASWVRVEASTLSPSGWGEGYCLELAELLVFQGGQNIALHKPVHTSSEGENEKGARKSEFLVDGFMPYLMHAAQGEKSVAFVGQAAQNISSHIRLDLDLGSVLPLNRIHLHTVELSDTQPQTIPSGFGLPERFLIEGATQPDFSDAVELVDYRKTSLMQTGPIIMRNLSRPRCRYLRLTAEKPYIPTFTHRNNIVYNRIGFAEIELFSGDENVALGKTISGNIRRASTLRTYQALTDGRNFYGELLPLREWLNQLARRHDLERERPRLTASLSRAFARQQVLLQRMGWVTAVLVVGIAFTALFDRLYRNREIARIRERFAADLHDELGANIHAIGMLNELANQTESAHDRNPLHRRISALTDRSDSAIRKVEHMAGEEDFYSKLSEEMQRTADRIATNMEHHFSIEGENSFSHLSPQIRSDLFLFYKESLVNICRHAEATQIVTRLVASPQELSLCIQDDGIGLPEGSDHRIPPSLQRRAQLLGARVTATTPANGGTLITLSLKYRRGLARLPLRIAKIVARQTNRETS